MLNVKERSKPMTESPFVKIFFTKAPRREIRNGLEVLNHLKFSPSFLDLGYMHYINS